MIAIAHARAIPADHRWTHLKLMVPNVTGRLVEYTTWLLLTHGTIEIVEGVFNPPMPPTFFTKMTFAHFLLFKGFTLLGNVQGIMGFLAPPIKMTNVPRNLGRQTSSFVRIRFSPPTRT